MSNLVFDKLKSLDESCRIFTVVKRYVNFFGFGKCITKKGVTQFVLSCDIESDVNEIDNRLDVIFDILLKAKILKLNDDSEYLIVSEIENDDLFN